MSKDSRILVTEEQNQEETIAQQAEQEVAKVKREATPEGIRPVETETVEAGQPNPGASRPGILDAQGRPMPPSPSIPEGHSPFPSAEGATQEDPGLDAFNQNLPEGVSARRNANGEIIIESGEGESKEEFALKSPPELIPQQVLMSSVQMTIGMSRMRLVVIQMMLARANIPGNEANPMLDQTILEFQKLFEQFGIPMEYWAFVSTCMKCPHMQDGITCDQCPEASTYKELVDKRFAIWTPPTNIQNAPAPAPTPPTPGQPLGQKPPSGNGGQTPATRRRRKLKRKK